MVHTSDHGQLAAAAATAVVTVNQLARELQDITAGPRPDPALLALKATELREQAAVIRTWAMLRDGA